jgi:nicotinamidase-related amidase
MHWLPCLESWSSKNSSGAFNSSPLNHYLHALEIRNLVVCGSATSRCVDGTARGAADRGYNVVLAQDVCIDQSD